MEYNYGVIESIMHEEGRIVVEPSTETSAANTYHEFHLKDHLGNVRVKFGDKNNNGNIDLLTYDELQQAIANHDENLGEIFGTYHYYPFGMNMEGNSTPSTGVTNRYKYNGKEEMAGLGIDLLDYGARFYDPSIARWTSVDPLAEKYLSISPYVYVANNPLKYIDPNGKEIVVPEVKNRAKVLRYINSRSSGVFDFDKKGKLFLTDKVNSGSNYGSETYTSRLQDGIDSELSIEIHFADNVKISDTETWSIDDNLGGGCTIGGVCDDQVVLISGNPKTADDLKDENGNQMTLEPEDILMHELVGHAIPKTTNTDTGNAVENENKVRAEYKDGYNTKRGDEPEHKEVGNVRKN